jgi:hypothetical protein
MMLTPRRGARRALALAALALAAIFSVARPARGASHMRRLLAPPAPSCPATYACNKDMIAFVCENQPKCATATICKLENRGDSRDITLTCVKGTDTGVFRVRQSGSTGVITIEKEVGGNWVDISTVLPAESTILIKAGEGYCPYTLPATLYSTGTFDSIDDGVGVEPYTHKSWSNIQLCEPDDTTVVTCTDDLSFTGANWPTSDQSLGACVKLELLVPKVERGCPGETVTVTPDSPGVRVTITDANGVVVPGADNVALPITITGPGFIPGTEETAPLALPCGTYTVTYTATYNGDTVIDSYSLDVGAGLELTTNAACKRVFKTCESVEEFTPTASIIGCTLKMTYAAKKYTDVCGVEHTIGGTLNIDLATECTR